MTWVIVAVLVVMSLVGFFGWRGSHKRRQRLGEGISLLVPYRADTIHRDKIWRWLREYWEHELPYAEIVIGQNLDVPFSKTSAVNDARSRAHGDVVAILDADCYLPGWIVVRCANSIRLARKNDHRMWFVPYRHFYRLTEFVTRLVLQSDPREPFIVPDPPPPEFVEPDYTGSSVGHWYGALIQIMPVEAFDLVGGMDTRFAGWGGEDASFMMALDTLYVPHRTTRNGVCHLWHPKLGFDYDTRRWAGQDISDVGRNNHLATLYQQARGRVDRMRKLVDGGKAVS
jgi:glycosyltransferase involved in cell wall biosynthesis